MPAFDQLILTTNRMVLRPLQESDCDALFAIFSEPEITRYWSTPPWASIDDARALVARDREAMPKGTGLRLGMVTKSDGKLVGNCSLFAFMEQCKRAELGYGMARAAWGQGLMHEALSALIGYAFNDLDLHRIEADIDPDNVRSANSLKRLGFQQEGHLRERWIVAGTVSDTALYGLLKRDWLALQQ